MNGPPCPFTPRQWLLLSAMMQYAIETGSRGKRKPKPALVVKAVESGLRRRVWGALSEGERIAYEELLTLLLEHREEMEAIIEERKL